MPLSRFLPTFLLCGALVQAWGADVPLDPQTEALIGQLPQVSQIGYGYSAQFSGSQFLPEPDAAEVGTLVLGSQAPADSVALEKIVRRGALAVPSLLKHLDDARTTKVPPVSGMMWTSYNDEYDFNRRLRKDPPAGVNKEVVPGGGGSDKHTITVGDLCFVALGQIVNRNFSATRYQPSGGMVVNSPTVSKRLCAVVRADFQDLTEETHRALLVQDFLTPDNESRLDGACRRLGFYYPQVLPPLALKQLSTSVYEIYPIFEFIRKTLYWAKSAQERKTLFDQ